MNAEPKLSGSSARLFSTNITVVPRHELSFYLHTCMRKLIQSLLLLSTDRQICLFIVLNMTMLHFLHFLSLNSLAYFHLLLFYIPLARRRLKSVPMLYCIIFK